MRFFHLFSFFSLMTFNALADDLPKDLGFEINQHNCNLPMQEIRKRLPDKAAQQAAIQQCSEAANKARWHRPSPDITTSSQNKQEKS